MTIVDAAAVRRIADMHAVYRMYDERDRLLYIGISGRAGRFDEHAIKRWFPLVSRIALEWYPTHAAARVAEKRAIAAEKPRYNVAGSTVAKRPVRGKTAEPETAEPRPLLATTLTDVLEVFGDDKNLYWPVLAERLAARFPGRWDGITHGAIQKHCRALGVPTVAVRMGQKVRRGCRRADVEQAFAQQVLAQAG